MGITSRVQPGKNLLVRQAPMLKIIILLHMLAGMMQLLMQNGRENVCQQRQNGNMQHVAEKIQAEKFSWGNEVSD